MPQCRSQRHFLQFSSNWVGPLRSLGIARDLGGIESRQQRQFFVRRESRNVVAMLSRFRSLRNWSWYCDRAVRKAKLPVDCVALAEFMVVKLLSCDELPETFFGAGGVGTLRAGEVALVASAVHAQGLHCRAIVPQGVP